MLKIWCKRYLKFCVADVIGLADINQNGRGCKSPPLSARLRKETQTVCVYSNDFSFGRLLALKDQKILRCQLVRIILFLYIFITDFEWRDSRGQTTA